MENNFNLKLYLVIREERNENESERAESGSYLFLKGMKLNSKAASR